MSGTVLIGCPTCGRRYRYDASRFGSQGVRIRCRTCEAVMRVDIPPALQPCPVNVSVPPGTAVASPEISLPQPSAGEPRTLEVQKSMVSESSLQADLPRALVAELDPEMRQLLTGCLEEEGYLVQAVDDGLDVRRFLAGWLPQVVVLNVFLPHILGVTLCSEIKRHPLLQETRVLLVGSLYRRDRFMRHPDDLYGADEFLDGNVAQDEIRRQLGAFCRGGADLPSSAEEPVGDEWSELMRLARIVVGDIILYNPQTADKELAAGRFLEAFAQEISEGEGLVAQRFSHLPDHAQVYHQTVKETVAGHCAGAGMQAGRCT